MERLGTAFPAELGDVQPVVWLVLVAVLYPPTLTDALVEKSMRRYARESVAAVLSAHLLRVAPPQRIDSALSPHPQPPYVARVLPRALVDIISVNIDRASVITSNRLWTYLLQTSTILYAVRITPIQHLRHTVSCNDFRRE